MRRREFITIVGGAAATWPLTARAQQPTKLVAVLGGGGGGSHQDGPQFEIFRKALAERGWHEQQNVRIEFRFSEGDTSRARNFATELVTMKPDVFFANNTPMTKFIQAKTTDIPIVFVQVPDPVGSGLIKNFAQPGGNATGFTNFEPSVAGKWLEFLKDAAPGVKRIIVILDATNPTAVGYEKAIEAAAPNFGVELHPARAHDASEINAAVKEFVRTGGGGLILPSSALATLNRNEIIELAARHGLPAMYPYDDFATSGGLMSYGIDRSDLYKNAALYVDRILRGEKASDLPVQAPTKFELLINLKTAKASGLTIPQQMLLLADQVVE